MQLPDAYHLEINYLSRLFENMSECYKIFWFQAVVNKAAEGKDTISFGELFNEMIADAWYMVTEYKLNLGPADTLETLIHYTFQLANQTGCLKSNDNKEKILSFLEQCRDKELIRMKRVLTYNVPYRLQSPFIKHVKGKEWNRPKRELEEKINQEKRLIYYFGKLSGLEQTIILKQEWMDYFKKNKEIINGWIQYNLIEYLQRRNPSVPGIVNKLYPPQERNLQRVKKYWKLLMEIRPVRDIYGDELLTDKNISIDHFVPWSYVAHDEFWNLHPTTRRMNSSKGNHLPEWRRYFPLLADVEYSSYQMVWNYPAVHKIFDLCLKEHVNNEDIKRRLYHEGLSRPEFAAQLEEIIFPVYQAAEHMGFSKWSV